MTQAQIAQIVAAIVNQKPAKKAAKAKVSRVESYEASVIKGFNAKGIKTSDLKLRENVLPFKKWVELGRIVSKGQHGVKGLFHVSQTEILEKISA